jgi:enterochelin esterase-like enzyme
MNRRDLLILAAAGLAMPGFARADETARGRLIRLSAVPSAHVKSRDVTVWLPPGYDASDDRYPVLYMHDGQNLFEAATANFGEWGVDEHLERLIAGGQVLAPIVVGVWNTDLRLREYIPADLLAALPDDMRGEVQSIYGGPALSDGYVRFLAEELKPLIDARFRTLTSATDTTISGSSMGGLISLYAVMKRPDVFSAAACLSTHWPLKVQGLEAGPELDAWRERLVAAWTGVIAAGLPTPNAHRFYFDRGDETLDGFYAEFQTEVDAAFRRQGYGPDRFTSLVFPGAQHNEASWNSRLDVPLKFLLSPSF